MFDKWLFSKKNLDLPSEKNTSCGLIGAGATERLGNGKPGEILAVSGGRTSTFPPIVR